MNKTFLKPYLIIFQLSFLMVILSSCSNQNSSTQEVTDTPKSTYSPLIENPIDSYNQLKFTRAVRSILEDSKGNYWFGSWNQGVCRYDGKKFTYFTTDDGLSHNQIRTIQEDQNGNIWFATGNGITSYDGKTFTIKATPNDLKSIKEIESEWKVTANDLWFNIDIRENETVVKGLCRYDNKNLSFLALPQEVIDQGICINTGTITGISKGKNGQMWFANYEGFFGYDGKSFQLFKDKEFPYHVRSIFEDSNGNLWIGNNGIGVLLFDGETLINFTEKHEVGNPDYYKDYRVSDRPGLLARVFSIGEDASGNIWFGTVDAGAWKYDGKELTNYTKEDGLTSMSIMEIYLDRKGVLWFGMGDGSVCQFNGKSFDKIY